MPNTQVRVVGSGFTTFDYNGQPIAFLEQIEDSGQRAFSDLGAGYQFIHPLGYRHPVEIATSRVLSGGTLMLTIRELWNAPVWQQLKGLSSSQNIVDIFEVLAENPQYVTCRTTIIPPPGTGLPVRGKIYQNCTVVDINDGDTITVGALSVTKGITVAYTHTTPLSGVNKPNKFTHQSANTVPNGGLPSGATVGR
jgi:hypothetical protein